jgi:hypothetical protein
MLAHLDVEPGMRVLEVGTGHGSGVVGGLHEQFDAQSVDVHVCRLDDVPRSVAFDRVIVTAPVFHVSYDWIRVLRDGGVLVLPWANPLSGPAVVRLVVDDERAAGSFVKLLPGLGPATTPGVSVFEVHADTIEVGDPTSCVLDPEEVWADPHALFALGMRLSDVRYSEAEVRDGGGGIARWLYDDDVWAGVTVSKNGADPRWTRCGYPNLWPAVEAAYTWWEGNDRPGPERFGMTVASFGQFGWLGDRYSGRLWRL